MKNLLTLSVQSKGTDRFWKGELVGDTEEKPED